MKIADSSRLLSLFVILLASGLASSSPHVTYTVMEPRATTSRVLLQAKTTCPEDFANKNYTVITSRCKGPNYPVEACCGSFKEFACPFSEVLNDPKSDCATTMFSYINLYGRYPPGIFANMCKEGKEGLDCSNVKTQTPSSAAGTLGDRSRAAAFGFGLLVLLMLRF